LSRGPGEALALLDLTLSLSALSVGGAMVKMPKNKIPLILMKIGDLVVVVFIEVYIKFQVKILIRTLLFS
jgi:hypothetical protein